MIKIEQAQEVAKRLRSLMGSWPLPQEAADTIDALIAELNDERMRCAQADNAVAQMVAELAALKGQEPVMYQARTSPNWTNGVWTKWEECSVGQAKDYKKCPLLNDWKYEARALHLAAGAQPYDQQAMEPCDRCGWKAIIPGEPCLMCERNDALAAGAQSIPSGYQLVPVEPTPEMVEAAYHGRYEGGHPSALYQNMLAAGAQLATKQEPVAWALPEITQQHNGQIVKHTAFHGYSVPLYLAAGAQERKPLLASEIVTMYAEQPMCDADMIEFAREIESAHGIKDKS